MKIMIVGSTGLIGRQLAASLVKRGDTVVAMSRTPSRVVGGETTIWDPQSSPVPPAAAEGVDAIVNLAGKGIADGRWGPRHRREIVESRVRTTERITAAVAEHGIGVLVNASAVGYYGETTTPVDERDPAGDDFLASVCKQWEGAARVAEASARVVRVRTGVVLAREGGALPRLATLARFGLNGPLGSGSQWQSWIHAQDAVAALSFCLDNATLEGPVNVCAPAAVRQRTFAASLGRVLHRPAVLRTPGFALHLALGQAAEMVLTGQQVVPRVLSESGFAFRHPDLEVALTDLLVSPVALDESPRG